MNKKTLALLLSATGILVILVAVGVALLYRSDSPRRRSSAQEPADATRTEAFAKAAAQSVPLLAAVPSDAAMLATFGNMRSALSVLTDSVHVLPSLLEGGARRGFPSFLHRLSAIDLGALRHAPTVVSLHYSGDLVPLLLVDAGSSPADTSEAMASILAAADSLKLTARLTVCPGSMQSRLKDEVLLVVSPSEALVTASQRHLESGASILDSRSFPEAASRLDGSDGLYFSHAYAEKVLPAFLQRPYSRHGGFVAKYAEWTSLMIKDLTGSELVLEGVSTRPNSDPAFVCNFLTRLPGGEIRAQDALPSSALFAVSVSTERLPEYLDAYRRFLDADRKLQTYRKAVTTAVDSVLLTPEKWALQWDIKEVVRACISTPSGLKPLVMLRPGKLPSKASGPASCPFASYPGLVFGELFNIPQPASFTVRDGWVFIGDPEVISMESPVIRDAAGPVVPKGARLACWYCPTAAPSEIDNVFKSPFAGVVRGLCKGSTIVPVTLTLKGEDLCIRSGRIASFASTSPAALTDTTVVVPAGPFRVKNSGTGKINSFSQAANGSLSLRDENGKGLWAIPFKPRLCGCVETIDYYANGKLQFLFAAGSKLYLIDRLGRFVSPFPVELGKEVRLGPGVYDFTGAHGYTVTVLHTDNTVEMYDLHGRRPSGWEGIASEEPVKALPELLKVGDKRYWAVRTSIQTLIYGFDGGAPLGKATDGKRIAPDSAFEVKGGSLVATCLDGKQRTIKL